MPAQPHASAVDAVMPFHDEMVDLSLAGWEELMALVTRLVSSVIGMLFRRLPRAGTARAAAGPRAQPLAAGPPAQGRARLLKRAHEIFGTGGKLFLTDAPDGTPGGIRTLVQIDGHIVTRATHASMVDADCVAEHQAKISAWFATLNRDWNRVSAGLTAAAAVATVGFAVDDAGSSAVALVRTLSGWESFADTSRYDGIRITFLKRAQIAAADLCRAGVVNSGQI